jgi:AhpD family alkylhydroperoxidase
MARIEPRKRKGISVRMINGFTRMMYGKTMEPTGVLAHRKAMLFGVMTLSTAAEYLSKRVDHRTKSLAMLRTAQLLGCEWCLDFGSRLAQDSGVPAADLAELSLWRSSERFSPGEKVALEYTEAMTRTPVDVSDELFARLQEHFDERQIVELTMTVSLENMYSRTNWALGIDGQGFSEGMYCVRPEAAAVLAANAV